MTIKEYLNKDPDFDIYEYMELEFADKEDEKEAIKNIEWVMKNEPNYEALCTVVRSYYDGTITWDFQ